VACDGGSGGELAAKAFGGRPGVVAFQLGVEFTGDFKELAIAGLPDFQERARVETARHRTALVEALFKRLADQVLLQPLTAGVLQNASQPVQFLPVETVQRILRIGHGALEI
jgi:hypothetical protein